jgi:hypothetical protein
VSSEPTPRPARSVAILADTDSRWKWAVHLARRLHPALPVGGYQLSSSDAPPSPRQLQAAGIEPARVRTVTAGELVNALAADAPDVLVVSLPGGGVQAVLHLLAAAALPRRPLVVTGYVGVVYEKVAEGLLLRAGADLIAANSPADLDRFRSVLRGAGGDDGSLVLTRLSFLGEPGRRPSGRFTVTFAGQPGVPATRWQRRYLVERLAAHAASHPERDVLLKLRALPGEQVTHAEPYPYDQLVRGLGAARPANLRVVAGDMGRALDRTDLLVTVSSTAAVEAIHRGVPTAVLTDFGIRESLGNAYFLGSGCLASFDDLDAGVVPAVDARWARRNGLGSTIDELPARVAQLLAQDRLPPLRPFYTAQNATSMLPGLLARYGVGLDGRPLGFGEGVPGLLRTAVRSSARTMYRHGANVVAPALRKLASL